VVGAHAALYRMRKESRDTPLANWARGLLSKKPFKLVAVALANKIARIAWVIMARSINFQPDYATGDSAKVAASA
jgi:transposase